ncbi:MAG: aromatic ring-hydroxylating dioxygenase subunit alpha [Actinomycetota bacterium]|nr:aromatic ring-hydroxylating dioxygenase subunit alpha [Actinomycetota bacterium]
MTASSADGRLNNTHRALERCWHPVARSGEIGERPARVLLLGKPYVAFRSHGELVAFADRCPHRLAPLSLGSLDGGQLRCAYHGWCFDRSGRCVEIPSLGPGAYLPPAARLQAPAGVHERFGMVFIAPQEPLVGLPSIPEAEQTGFEMLELAPTEARASAGLMADNFLDFAHFPFVHAGTFGTDESKVLAPYEVERDGFSFKVVYEHPFANREDPGVAAGIRPLVQTRRMTYLYQAPFFLSLRLEFLEARGTSVIGFFIQPEDDERCRLYTTLWRDDLGEDPAARADAIAFEQRVLNEDLVVQSRYDELSLPLDLRTEVHTRADRNTMELRRVLAELVLAANS